VSVTRQRRHTEQLRSAEAALALATGRTGALERELRDLEHQHAVTVEAVRDEAARDLVTMVCSALTPASSASTPLLQSLADSAAAADPARALQQVVTALTAQLANNQSELQALQQQLLQLSNAASEAQRSEAAAAAETAALRTHNAQLDARLATITDTIDRNEGAHSSSRAGASITASATTATDGVGATSVGAEDAAAVLAEVQNDLQEVTKREQAASRAAATLRADLEHERQRYESLAAMLNSAAFRRGSAVTGAVVADSSVVQLQAVQELLQQLESLQAAADAGSVEHINEGESPLPFMPANCAYQSSYCSHAFTFAYQTGYCVSPTSFSCAMI
jgi:chromosome segregation ATPase